jgi:hypothetical protein
MPAIITHYTFALENLKEPLSPYQQATLLGAQGPDIFFFYGQLPWRRRAFHKEVDAYGRLIHHIDQTEEYAELTRIASASVDKDLLFAYIEGLFMHYCLDRACHPYIFYKSGFTDDPTKKKGFSCSHMALETVLDLIIGTSHKTFIAPQKPLSIEAEQCKKISAMWAEMNRRITKKEGIGDAAYYLARRDYATTLASCYSPHGVKKALFKLFLGEMSYPYCMSYPKNLDRFPGVDFLNEKHEEWLNAVTGEKRYESFMELMGKAASDYSSIHTILLQAKSGKDVKEEIRSFVAATDHDGFAPGAKKTYYSLIWPIH